MSSFLLEQFALEGEKCNKNKKRSVRTVVGQVAVSLFFLGSLILITLPSLSGNGNHIDKRRNLYQKVAVIADTNKDHYTSQEEWAQVYRELGLQYNVHSSNPEEDLTSNQLEQYLLNNQ